MAARVGGHDAPSTTALTATRSAASLARWRPPAVRTGLPRVRKCFITYHLEDGTVDVREPREINIGSVQGALLHRMPCNNANGQPMSFTDVKVGQPIAIHSRTYNVLGKGSMTWSNAK